MPVSARVGLWLIFAGGLSNLYDRLRYGYVIDFLELGFIRTGVQRGDVCIVAGCVLTFIAVLRMEGRGRSVADERCWRVEKTAGRGWTLT